MISFSIVGFVCNPDTSATPHSLSKLSSTGEIVPNALPKRQIVLCVLFAPNPLIASLATRKVVGVPGNRLKAELVDDEVELSSLDFLEQN